MPINVVAFYQFTALPDFRKLREREAERRCR
jgi:hypothetical protein